MSSRLFTALTVFVLIAATAVFTFAQVTAGRVTGSVVDPNGAILPGASVTLTNKSTGVAFSAQTTGSGSFTFPNVPTGSYTIRITATGFSPLEQAVTVLLNQESTVNATMAIGSTETNIVNVTAASEALIQTESSTLGKTYETQLVQNLPTFGDQNSLALLSANVVGQSAGTAGSGGTVGGVRPRYNVFTIDGIENNDPSVTGPATSVIQDAISEFTLLQNNFSAEFGQGGGGQFVTVTKSGTNSVNGSAFVYGQHQWLNAASTSEEALLNAGTIAEKPKFRDTRFGATIGGPVIKNKLFYFAAYEQRHIGQDATSTSYLAPTDLGSIAQLPGVSPFVIDILRNNLILPTIATTTRTVLGVPMPFGEVSTVIPAGSLDKQFQTNVDWNPSDRDQFRFRFSFDNFSASQAGNGHPKFNNNQVYQTRLFSASYIKAFSSALVNELRLSYRRAVQDFPLVDPTNNDFPNITVGPLNLAIGPDSNLPQSSVDNTYQVFNTLNYITGPHTFKFGAEYRNINSNSDFLPRGRGDYIYTTLDELLLDDAPTDVAIRGVGSGSFVSSHQHFYFFGQDDWKITQNLTLNLGARYELLTLPRDTRLQALNSIANVPGFIEFGIPKTDKNNIAPRVGFAYSPDFGGKIGNFLFGKGRTSSIRGNFGMSFAQIFQNLNLLQLPPQFQQEINVNDLSPAEIAALGIDTDNFLASGHISPIPIPPTTVDDARFATSAVILDQRFGEIYSFTLGFQRELPGNMAMELRYLGTRSRHMPIQNRLFNAIADPRNLIIPTFLTLPSPAQLANLPDLGTVMFGDSSPAFVTPLDEATNFLMCCITAFVPEGNSNYDAGSISVTRRFSDGLAFTTAYTYSRTMSNSDNELFTSLVNPRRTQDSYDFRNEWSLSTFDIPHRFVFAANWEPTWFSKSGNALLRTFAGGWAFAPIFQTQSGQPFTPNSGIDSNLNFDSAGDRTIVNPNGVHGTGSAVVPIDRNGNVIPVSLTGGNLFGGALDNTVAYLAVNPNAQYIRAGYGALATAGRNTLRARGFNRTDLTVLKNFRFGEEQYNVQVGVEIFNLMNQRIRTIAGVGATSSAFANVNSSFFNNYSIGNFAGRTIQFRAKFTF